MDELGAGLYNQLVTALLVRRLEALNIEQPVTNALGNADAGDRIAWHVGHVIERVVNGMAEENRAKRAAELVNELLSRVDQLVANAGMADEAITMPPQMLDQIRRLLPDGSFADIKPPEIPVIDTALLTNAPGEPALWSQLNSEIESADRVDLLMAFIVRSGVRPLLDELAKHRAGGKPLRVITTTFTNTTEQEALDQLAQLGAEIRVSYDTTSSRLHAKAWLFERATGFSTAYIGSSNLTHTAHGPGLEWNVRLSEARNRAAVEKFRAVFDSYWQSDEFAVYDPDEFRANVARQARAADQQLVLSPIEIRPFPFQQRLLEQLAVARHRGHHRNLLVAATGTGKTVMAAVDYSRLRNRLDRSRLLFIAHREEILDQSRATFAHALRDPTFGEKWVGGSRPRQFDHVFASIQSLNANDLAALDPEHFDVVIVDEFHHAAAASYERILRHLRPRELLGLTATPERSDGAPILNWFDGRIAAELRLWDAIDQQHLSPFVYYGIHDGTDLGSVPWTRGRGYDIDALTNVYTSDQAWARRVIHEVAGHADTNTMRALGFCVSVSHAHFMADQFRAAGISAVAVSGDTNRDERKTALSDLASGQTSVVFSVDLFNEGVDVPDVDTLLLLRPTESPTLFIQQLGRGLRRTAGKPYCTVLDFVGLQRREFRFDRKYRALLGGTRTGIERAIKNDFPYLPAGCSMQLDPVATATILRSLREALPSRWPEKVNELRSLLLHQSVVGLAEYLVETGLDLDDVYSNNRCWSDLLQDAEASLLAAGPHEKPLRRAIGRQLHVDDDERLATYRRFLSRSHAPVVDTLGERERRVLHMLVASMCTHVGAKDLTLQEGADLLWQHPQVVAELVELFGVLEPKIDHLHTPLASHPDVPLQVHARYNRLEILAAMAEYDTAGMPSWQSGVWEAKQSPAELLAFTLDKSSGNFSTTTRYKDYAISRSLIHWQSQANTRADSRTGQRYQHHAAEGRTILLFARLTSNDTGFWFLGPATYQSHAGEQPMAITWKLHTPLPADLYQSFAAAVA